jgi:tetratricopeptide (TPR) repeat protein
MAGRTDEEIKKELFTEERKAKVLNGEMTFREFFAVSGPEMLQSAMLGFHMYEAGKYADAEAIFEGLAALDPNESYYQTALGAVFLAQEEFEKALTAFDQAIKINSKDNAAFVNRGEVHLRMGKVLEAAQDFQSAVKLDGEGKDPLTMRAKVLAAAALQLIQSEEAKRGGGKAPEAKGKPAPDKGAKKK